MKKRKTLFCITLVICGLIIGILILFQTPIQAVTSRLENLWILGLLIAITFYILVYRVKCNKRISRWICKQTKSSSGIPKTGYRIEHYVLYWWKVSDSTEPQPTCITVKNRRGRRSDRPTEEKLRAIKKWDNISQGLDPVRLEEFLAAEFGTTSGELNVPKDTFYYWRRKLGKQAIQKKAGRRK